MLVPLTFHPSPFSPSSRLASPDAFPTFSRCLFCLNIEVIVPLPFFYSTQFIRRPVNGTTARFITHSFPAAHSSLPITNKIEVQTYEVHRSSSYDVLIFRLGAIKAIHVSTRDNPAFTAASLSYPVHNGWPPNSTPKLPEIAFASV